MTSRDSNSVLPYSQPAPYHMSYATPCELRFTLTNLILQEVQSGAFANMTRLVRLILTKNKIHRLEEGSLTGASIFVSQVRLYVSHRCVYICLTGASIIVSQVRLYLSLRCVYICLTGASIFVSQVRLYLSNMQQYLLRKMCM